MFGDFAGWLGVHHLGFRIRQQPLSELEGGSVPVARRSERRWMTMMFETPYWRDSLNIDCNHLSQRQLREQKPGLVEQQEPLPRP